MEISSDSGIQPDGQRPDPAPESLLIPPPSFAEQINPALLERIKNKLDSQTLDSQTLISGRLGLTFPLLAEPDVQHQLTQTLVGANRDAAFLALSMIRISCSPETKSSLLAYVAESSNPLSLRIRCVLALKACSEDPSVVQVLLRLSQDPLVVSLRQATALALIPIRGAPTDSAISRLQEMASSDLDATTRWQATRELFLCRAQLSSDTVVQILGGPCDLDTFLLGLPLHTGAWSPAFMQRVLQLYGEAPGAKPWETMMACKAGLYQQRDAYPRSTATSLIAALLSLHESGALRPKVTHQALNVLEGIFELPHPDWGPAEKDSALQLFRFFKDRFEDQREISSAGGRSDEDLCQSASRLCASLVKNNHLPEQAYGQDFLNLSAGMSEETQLNLKRAHLANEAIHNTSGYGSLFSFLSSLPGRTGIAVTFSERVLSGSQEGFFSSSLKEAFAYIDQQQSSWNHTDYHQIRGIDLMHALHTYKGPDADEVRACIEERYLRLTSEQLPIQLYHALCAPSSTPRAARAACPWDTFPLLGIDPKNLSSLPTTISPFCAQQILEAAHELNTYIQKHLTDEPTTLGSTGGGVFSPIKESPTATYAELFASTEEVVSKAIALTNDLLSEMGSLSPLIRDLPNEAFLLGPVQFNERLTQAGITPDLHDKLLDLIGRMQAVQAEVNTSLNLCLIHLRQRLDSYSRLSENQHLRVSSLECRLARSYSDIVTLYASIGLAGRIRTISSVRVLFSQMLADFGEALTPLVLFFSSRWRGDPEVAHSAVDCAGKYLCGDGNEQIERSPEVIDWVDAACKLGYPIPEELEPLAYLGAANQMATAGPSDFLHKDFRGQREIVKLESSWLSDLSGPERDNVQTLLRYAAIQLRFPGFARYLGTKDLQQNLVSVVNSKLPYDLRELAVFALSHYGCQEYGHIQLRPPLIQALIKAASTKKDPIAQIYNIRSIPDLHIEENITKLSARGSTSSAAAKRLAPLVSLLEKSDSRDVRLEIVKKLLPALLQSSPKHDFIREPILRALGRVPDHGYLTGEMENLLVLLDGMFDWTRSPESVAALLRTGNKLPPEILNCYDLLDFLFAHEASSDQEVALGASFLLNHIFG